MRLLVPPPADDGHLAVHTVDGSPIGTLWLGRFAGVCDGRRMDARVISVDPLDMPALEPSEPVAGAIARLASAVRGRQAIVALLNPGEALGPDRIAYADGVRLFGISTAADEATWDAMLTLGLPVWGWRGTMVLDAMSPTVTSAWSAIAYGLFHAADGQPLHELMEDRNGISWSAAADAQATAVIRGGFEDACLGASGRRDDRGNEGYVRLIVRAPSGTCWTQPRFVVPARRGFRG